MKITDIIAMSEQPPLYEKGSAFMWTDKHISKQLLNIHLNPDTDMGSRKMSTVIETADRILTLQKSKRKLKILDLGCGPGLYAEIFAQNGHDVTGIDISESSVDYAKKSAKDKGLEITYINADYLKTDEEANKYDLITLIYTDIGVLHPDARSKLLNFIRKTLKKGGMFVFDVLRDNNLPDKVSLPSREASSGGFWKPGPYLALSHSFLYDEQKVILYRHIVIDPEEKIRTYHFWTHFFSQDDVFKMLKAHKFADITFLKNVLPEGDQWNGDNVIFCAATK